MCSFVYSRQVDERESNDWAVGYPHLVGTGDGGTDGGVGGGDWALEGLSYGADD